MRGNSLIWASELIKLYLEFDGLPFSFLIKSLLIKFLVVAKLKLKVILYKNIIDVVCKLSLSPKYTFNYSWNV